MKFYRLVFSLFTLFGCSVNSRTAFYLDQLKTMNEMFNSVLNEKNALGHFPISKDLDIYLGGSKAPTESCKSKYGYFYITLKNDNVPDVNTLKNKVIFSASYKDKNTLIYFDGLKKTNVFFKKCNNWYKGTIPIPFFEDFNFGLGKNVNLSNDSGIIYKVPDDLKVYVLDAKSGNNIWKVKCENPRPKTLQKWQHGFSRGYATSKKENLITYWVIVW